MIEFLIFYYFFSLFFMIGYVDFRDLNGIGDYILGIVALLILAPIFSPINLGYAIRKISK